MTLDGFYAIKASGKGGHSQETPHVAEVLARLGQKVRMFKWTVIRRGKCHKVI